MKSPLIVRLLQAELCDIARLEPDVKGLDRDIITIKARFEHEGYGFLTVALSSLCDAVDYGLATGRFACPTGFAKCQRGALPKLFSGLLCKVFDTRTGSLKEDPCVRAIKCLREALRLFKKLKLDSDREELLSRDAVRTFWDAETACRGSFDPLRASLLSRISGYTLTSLGFYRPDEIIPRHGPGAVYERLAPNQKWYGVYQSILQEDFEFSRFGMDIFSCSNKTAEDLLMEYLSGSQFTEALRVSDSGTQTHRLSSRGLARLVTVAKNSTSRRTITVEPLVGMFIQQGLNTVMRRAIDKCQILSHCLALTDQSVNQTYALEGSRTGEWSTIDLSSASDLLSLEVVKLVLAKHTLFLEDVLSCRSSHVVGPNDVPTPVNKFAGMGNALTFPVQSAVFANIAMAAILFEEGYSAPSHGAVVRASRLVRVYGDDIIVPTAYARQVVDWIESFGLKVNRKKSFMEGNFRESCGLDAYKGVDVTPIYLRDDPDKLAADPSAIASLVSTANQLWLACRYETAMVLQDAVEAVLGPLPLLPAESGGLGWCTRDGKSQYQRWNRDLHQLEVRAPVVVPKLVKDNIDGYPALLKFYLTPLIERNNGHLKRSVKRFRTRIAWRWMPANAGSLSTDRLIPLRDQSRRYIREIRLSSPRKGRNILASAKV